MVNNYLVVLARRRVNLLEGKNVIRSRPLAFLFIDPDDIRRAERAAYLFAARMVEDPSIGGHEQCVTAIFRVTADTPSWVQCIGRNWRMAEGKCLNCGRPSCGMGGLDALLV